MNRFTVHSTPIDGLKVIERHPVRDTRGFLERIFCQNELGLIGGDKVIRQINRTLTRKKGTVRGLHFQYPPHAETKIVTCVKGIVWDVAVDIRRDSPTFLKHHAVTLTAANSLSYLIPEGFAHGFQTLTANCEILYLHTADHSAQCEGGLNATDKLLSIPWPGPVTERSERDLRHPILTNDFKGLAL